MNITHLPTVDDVWFLVNKELGCSESALVVERLFRYAAHWIYKERFCKSSYLIPGWRRMPNPIRRKIKILGNFLDSILEICVSIFGSENAGCYFDAIANELKQDYRFSGKLPTKREWVAMEKAKRGKLIKSTNPFSPATHPLLWNLINKALLLKDGDNRFRLNQWQSFLDNYKLWADSVSSEKDWLTKVN